ncbi:MAG: serine hydrolase [Gemmatimonadaceae bacterium]
MALALCLSTGLQGQPPRDADALQRTLDSLADAHRGVVGFAVHNMETGTRLSRRGDEPFPTASLVKVPILVTVFDLVEQGKLRLDDRLTLLAIDKVPGSGQLQFMHDGAVITVHDAAWLMTTISDNTATNLLLDRIIIRRVWASSSTTRTCSFSSDWPVAGRRLTRPARPTRFVPSARSGGSRTASSPASSRATTRTRAGSSTTRRRC